jgi:hypothetical protein
MKAAKLLAKAAKLGGKAAFKKAAAGQQTEVSLGICCNSTNPGWLIMLSGYPSAGSAQSSNC